MRVVQRAATFPPSLVRFAACVLDRESGGTLDRRQSGAGARYPDASVSSASGRWQFINNDWQHSLPWHVRDRLIQFGMSKAQANEVRGYLDKRPIWKWDGWLQDIGFIETMERGGRHHWNGGSHSC